MKLHRELGIGQKAAWFMLHRLQEACLLNKQCFLAQLKQMKPLWAEKRRTNVLTRH